MKHLLTLTLVLVIMLSLLLGSGILVAQADDVDYDLTVPEDVTHSLGNNMRITHNDNQQKVMLVGEYFVLDGDKISFTIDIYDRQLYKDYEANGYKLDRLTNVMNEVHSAINYMDTLVNTQYAESDVYRYNHANVGETISISDMTAQILTHAKTMYELTNHAYNPAVYRLVDLWAFSSRNTHTDPMPYDDRVDYVPSNQYIDAFVQLADFDQVELGGGSGSYTLTKRAPAVTVDGVSYTQWIDLGGVAKGYAVELASDILEKHGLTHYFVNSGSSSMKFTSYEDGSNMTLAISEPNFFGVYLDPWAEMNLLNTAVSTSGQYIRKRVIEGASYSHIIDGTAGRPTTSSIEMVTVLGGSAWANDCLTTALTVMGEDAVEFMNDTDTMLSIARLGMSTVASASGCVGVDYIGLSQYAEGKFDIITNIPTNKLMVNNAEYDIITDVAIDSDGNRQVYLDGQSRLGEGQYTWLLVLGIVLLVTLVGIILYTRYHHAKSPMFNIDNVRHGKPYIVWDILVYAVVAVGIVALLFVFVFVPTPPAYDRLEMVSTLTDELVFSYERESGRYYVIDNGQYRVDIEETDSELTAIVYYADEEDTDKFLNVLHIDKHTGSAKMTDSHCGHGQDCVRVFGAIEHVGDTIVCSPNHFKVVGLGGDQ